MVGWLLYWLQQWGRLLVPLLTVHLLEIVLTTASKSLWQSLLGACAVLNPMRVKKSISDFICSWWTICMYTQSAFHLSHPLSLLFFFRPLCVCSYFVFCFLLLRNRRSFPPIYRHNWEIQMSSCSQGQPQALGDGSWWVNVLSSTLPGKY